MNTAPRLLFVLSSIAALHACASAAPKVEETVLGPINAGGAYVIAPRGAHVAYAGRNGAKYFVSFDGVKGPEFDELFKSSGQGFYYPEKPSIYPGKQNGAQQGDSPVVFSEDGEHYAYVARAGDEYVVIHDGKEIGRGPRKSLTIYGNNGMLSITPKGKHVFWAETEFIQNQGRSMTRVVVSGKRGPFAMAMASTVPVFSADESRYAYVLGQAIDTGKQMLVVDGKDAGYLGQQPAFTADGSTLLCISYEDGKGAKSGLLANGKIVYPGSVGKIFVAPVGKRWAVFGSKPFNNGRVTMNAPILVVDGKEIAGSEYVQEMWFSPDGKRYAARIHDMMTQAQGIVIDGEAYTLRRVDQQAPYWTGDSSKVIFTGASDDGEILGVNDDLYPRNVVGTLDIATAPRGDQYSWISAHPAARAYSVYVGEKSVLPPGLYATSHLFFSPDGSRFGFHVGQVGQNGTTGVVIDGALQTGMAAASFWNYYTQNLSEQVPVVFSPDGKHAAFLGYKPGTNNYSLYVDGKAVFATTQLVVTPRFSPDSQHLFWIGTDVVPGSGHVSTLYVDGQPAARAPAQFFWNSPGTIDVDDKGVATFLGPDGDVLKRFRVVPASDTNVATLLEKGTTVVAAAPPAAPKPAPAPAAATTPPPASKPTTPPPSTATAAPAVALTWNDLVRRPETRPTTCTVNKDYRFQSGATVRAGTKVNIVECTAMGLGVATQDGQIHFEVKPDETDVVAVANAAWAQLTPAQRDLTFAALLQRMDLWPYVVKLTDVVRLEGQTLAAGEPVQFLGFEGQQPLVRHAGSGVMFNAELNQIDLIAKARALVASEAGAPGRLLEELAAAKLVSPLTGQPAALDLNSRPKYVVMYRGANWCAPCHAFSPGLVKLLKEKAPKSADVALIYISADNNAAEAKTYVTKIGIDWPTIYYKSTDQLPAFHSLFGDAIPQLVVTDRHGKVVVDSSRVGTDRALQQLAGLL